MAPTVNFWSLHRKQQPPFGQYPPSIHPPTSFETFFPPDAAQTSPSQTSIFFEQFPPHIHSVYISISIAVSVYAFFLPNLVYARPPNWQNKLLCSKNIYLYMYVCVLCGVMIMRNFLKSLRLHGSTSCAVVNDNFPALLRKLRANEKI